MFVMLEKNIDGSHTFQSGGSLVEGWAVVPKDMALPDTFPFVNIEVEEVFYPAIVDENNHILRPAYTQLEVVSMTAGEEIEVFVEETTAPTQLDAIEAQVAYTAMMTDTLLEV